MQHHAHPPHMRPHHMAIHPSAALATHLQPPMGIAATPQRQAVVATVAAQQQKQNTLPNAAAAAAAAAAGTTQLQPAAHLSNGPLTQPKSTSTVAISMQHHNRLGQPQPHHHPQSIHSTSSASQMQKIRQQHQHLNNNNSNNNNNNNNTNKSNQQYQQYNHSNALTRPQHQQLQRNVAQHQHFSQQQQVHMTPHVKNHLPQQQPIATNSSNSSNSSNNNNTTGKLHPQQSYYAGNNSTKYYNPPPANANFSTPKTILQNPNRVIKTRMPSLKEVPISVGNTNTSKTNNIEVVVSDNIAVTPDQGAPLPTGQANCVDTEADVQKNQVVSSEDSSGTDSKNAQKNVNKENSSSSNNNNNNIMTNNKNNILSNEDIPAARNSKEKTPMCLVNELARFNKITHQYRLTSEKGPAHSKRFTVTLKLGEEEYSAEGFKIKKAQHLAAAEAIEKTKYKHPLPKINRRSDEGTGFRANITPTVELNALAMKLGQQTYYLLDPRQMPQIDAGVPSTRDGMLPNYGGPIPPPPSSMMPPPPPHARIMDPAYMRRNNGFVPPHMPHPLLQQQRYGQRGGGGYPPKYHQRYPLMPLPPGAGGGGGNLLQSHHPFAAYPPPSVPCKITLIVGQQKFLGIGCTLQQAKHDAAARALQVMKAEATNQLNELLHHSLEESDSKSPVSLVHEIGIKRNLTVHFKVLREEGPAHMKNFITACIVGSIATEGEGNGKKISKKRAAEKMLEELKKLPPLTPTKSPVKRIKVRTPVKAAAANDSMSNSNGKTVAAGTVERRRRAGASIKEKPEMEAEDDDENPITKLIQLQQTRKEKEPIFELIAKNGNENSRRREYIMEVTTQGMVARGTGSNKKLAKRMAAQNLLAAMASKSSQEIRPRIDSSAVKETAAAVSLDNRNTSTTQAGTSSAAVITKKITAASIASFADCLDVPLISTSAGQVPGILILRQNKKQPIKKKDVIATTTHETVLESKKESIAANDLPATTTETEATAINTVTATPATKTKTESNTEDAIMVEAITATNTNTATTAACTATTTATNSNTVTGGLSGGVHMKNQLLYLAKLLGFEVNFSDYPKGNHNDFLTIVTLSTDPPQICHGVGTSAEESQNDAARNALKILSELGLNNAKK